MAMAMRTLFHTSSFKGHEIDAASPEQSQSSGRRMRTAPAVGDSKIHVAEKSADRAAHHSGDARDNISNNVDYHDYAYASDSRLMSANNEHGECVEYLGEIDRALDTMNERLDDLGRKNRQNNANNGLDSDDASAAPSEVQSEASMMVLMRYMGLSSSSRPYMTKPKTAAERRADEINAQFTHDLREGDHVIRWKMLGFCYPIQIHGIVFSAGPDFVTIVDCSQGSDNGIDKVGNFDEHDRKNPKKARRRMNILTLVDEKEIKKWTKIRYGEEVQLRVHSKNEEMRKGVNGKELSDEFSVQEMCAPGIEESPSAGLEMEEVEQCVQAKIKQTPQKSSSAKSNKKSWSPLACYSPDPDSAILEKNESYKPIKHENSKQKSQKLRLPKADPPMLVLARLRFLLEYGEEPFPPPSPTDTTNDTSSNNTKKSQPTLLPPHHLLYANSECIAVFCKTGSWSTLQASIFLHSSTVGNVKSTATVAMFLSAQTVTVPASGFWGFFGGTTTISLFTAQPWLVPALVGGGMVYIGLPMLMLRKAKGRWGDTERRLNDAFWSMCDTDVIAEMIRCWSGLEVEG